MVVYAQFMGHMDVISFISDGFNIYFPIAIVLLCILTWFNVGQRVLHLVGFQQFIGDDDMTQELIDEGAQLVSRGSTNRLACVDFLTQFNDCFHFLAFLHAIVSSHDSLLTVTDATQRVVHSAHCSNDVEKSTTIVVGASTESSATLLQDTELL